MGSVKTLVVEVWAYLGLGLWMPSLARVTMVWSGCEVDTGKVVERIGDCKAGRVDGLRVKVGVTVDVLWVNVWGRVDELGVKAWGSVGEDGDKRTLGEESESEEVGSCVLEMGDRESWVWGRVGVGCDEDGDGKNNSGGLSTV